MLGNMGPELADDVPFSVDENQCRVTGHSVVGSDLAAGIVRGNLRLVRGQLPFDDLNGERKIPIRPEFLPNVENIPNEFRELRFRLSGIGEAEKQAGHSVQGRDFISGPGDSIDRIGLSENGLRDGVPHNNLTAKPTLRNQDGHSRLV